MNRYLFIGGKIRLWLGGGPLKYRARGCRVEMKGGGTGPFWGFAHFSDFETPEQADVFARKWAETEGGSFCGGVNRIPDGRTPG
jgi:hypothetical protein